VFLRETIAFSEAQNPINTLCAHTEFLMCQMDGKHSKYRYLKGTATPMGSVNQTIIPKHRVKGKDKALNRPAGFQEVKAPRFLDIGT
jgi:hypothetical protein